MHVQAANQTELRDLDTIVQDRVVLLRDTLLLFTEEKHAARGELKVVKHHGVGSLLNSDDLVAIGLLVDQVVKQVVLLYFIDG